MEIALENPSGFTIRFGHRLRRCHCRPSTDAQSTGWRYRSGLHCQLFNWAWYLSLEEQIWHPSHGFRIGGTVSSHPVSPLALDTDTSQSQLHPANMCRAGVRDKCIPQGTSDTGE